jgi:hypothetical protein
MIKSSKNKDKNSLEKIIFKNWTNQMNFNEKISKQQFRLDVKV